MWAVPMVAARRSDVAFLVGLGSPGVSMAQSEVHRRVKALRDAGVGETTQRAVARAWQCIFAVAASGTADQAMISELGEGGMATVFLAIQHSLDRKVAIKVMRRELRASNGPMPEFERRFLLEGRTMAKLPHRNIVAVYDIVTREDIAYISMEYLEGVTLKDLIRNKGALPVPVGLRIVKQMCQGLEAAHLQGVVHRDIKPQNMLILPETGAKGLASVFATWIYGQL
jgi:RIO-like serine/threonine protein kinase